ncbi:MAG: nucleotide exchange factor GrpE [Lachnospiraceae bacterium]|nr:nucleotide exchange factor GrpE [Lachnospiraceae bacterium]
MKNKNKTENTEEIKTDVSVEKAKEEEEKVEAEAEEKAEEKVEEEAEESKEEKDKDSKKEKKDKKDLEIESLNDRILRQMAEFDNYRKRTEKEKNAMFDMGAKNIVEKILPVIDNFERGFDGLSEEEKAAPFAAGMEKVYKQMMTGLQEAGLKEIEALNCEFNPDLHNAVMHVEDENVGENTIVEVFQKGYYYKDTIVRHSMVKVAN